MGGPSVERLASDVVVIGAGPAGLCAAIHAADAGARVVVVERNGRPGVKLLSTGGGHCNLTTTDSVERIVERFGRQGRFMRDALRRMGPDDLRSFFASLGVSTCCADGRHVYPESQSSGDVQRSLMTGCEKRGVDIRLDHRVTSLTFGEEAIEGVVTDRGAIGARGVILATGGLSYPSFGSTGDGYGFARQAGHQVVKQIPALVGLVASEDWIGACAGTALPNVTVWIESSRKAPRFTGDLMLTHRGVSGPAILDLSGEVGWMLDQGTNVTLRIDLTPGVDAAAWAARLDAWRRDDGASMVRTLLGRHIPSRIAAELVGVSCSDAEVRASKLAAAERRSLTEMLTRLPVTITSTEGFDRAMVTRGGVSLKDVNPKTLMSRKVGGLYFAGEVLDLDGPCGGYNLQWAFSSGALAGASAAHQDGV